MLYRSPDGIHWTKASDGAKACDRSTFFYNPFRQRWVFSIRDYWQRVRTRYYWETTDFFSFSDAYKANKDAVKWTAADSNDQPRNDLQVRPQLYNLDCVAYESIMLGMFTIWRGDYRDLNSKKAKEMVKLGRPKTNSVCVGFSRDGFHWDRPDRQPFLPISETRGDWNWGNLQSTVPCCLVVGEKLWFYVSGRAGKSFRIPQKSIDAGASTGVAFLRRDGFASMDAGEQSGELITRPLRFSGGRLFVNADVKSDGELLVEVLDKNNQPIAPFTRENCVPVKVDKTLVPVRWNGATDLADLAGKTVKFRFILKQGRLYSFWVSPNESGASHGYVAGGGPGFTGPTDTVGSGGYGKNEAEKAINK